MKRTKYIQFLFILMFFTISTAEEATQDFFIKASIDSHITSSQNAGTDVAFSAISSLAYLSNKFKLNDNPLYRLGISYGAAMITIFNHELFGHGFRALELGDKIIKLNMGLSIFEGSLEYERSAPYHVQKDTIVSLGGMQANYLLSQKISDNLLLHNQKIDPITSVDYIFSAIDQIYYNYMHVNPHKPGHDLRAYTQAMEKIYGDQSMSLDTIKYHGF